MNNLYVMNISAIYNVVLFALWFFTNILSSIYAYDISRENVFGAAAVNNECKINGFELAYASSTATDYTLYWDLVAYPFYGQDGIKYYFCDNLDKCLERKQRSDKPNPLYNDHIICYEPNPSSIRAIVSPTTKNSCSNIRFKLTSYTNKKFEYYHREVFEPYYLYGNQNSIIYGEILKIGKYSLSVIPNYDKTLATNINFEVMDCGNAYTWIPPNNCRKCTKNQVCLASDCIDTGDLSFHLIRTGSEFDAYDMSITKPDLTSYSYDILSITKPDFTSYSYDTFDNTDNNKNDIEIGGKGEGESCRLTERFVKSLIFPNKVMKGKYKINIYQTDYCGTPDKMKYEVQVFYKHQLVKTFTNVRGNNNEFIYEVL